MRCFSIIRFRKVGHITIALCPGSEVWSIKPSRDVLRDSIQFARTDWDKWAHSVWKDVVYIGRYGAQDIDKVQHWPLSKIRRISGVLSKLIKAENPDPGHSGAGSW